MPAITRTAGNAMTLANTDLASNSTLTISDSSAIIVLDRANEAGQMVSQTEISAKMVSLDEHC
jgi:hypothetical protein